MDRFERIKNMGIEEMVLFLHSINHFGYGFMNIDGQVIVNEGLKKWLEIEIIEGKKD